MEFTISVIIPTHNRAGCLARALDSVMVQTHAAREIIVVDDGSTDATQMLMRNRYPQAGYYFQSRQGVSNARNRGITLSHCDWVAFLDSDDRWLPNKLEKQIEILTRNPEIQFCHTNEIWVRNGTRVKKQISVEPEKSMFEQSLARCVISPSSVLANKELIEKTGGFDESLPVCEDYDLWLKICANHPVAYVQDPLLVKHGGHDDQLSTQYWGMDRFRVEALEKIICSDTLSQSQLYSAREMLIKKCRIIANGAMKRNKLERAQEYRTKMMLYKGNQPS